MAASDDRTFPPEHGLLSDTSSLGRNSTTTHGREEMPHVTAPLMKFKTYLSALRPWSLSASLMPTLLGTTLAVRVHGYESFGIFTFLCTVLTVVTVHCAGNVVNTYYDFVKGIDDRKADDRTLVDHILSQDEVVTLGVLLYGAGCVGFVFLVYLSPAKLEHLALVYFGGLSSSFLYTGGIGLKYIALGDVLILVIFGPISVLFSYMAQTGYIEWATFLYAIPLALNTEAILHSNNTRDAESDKRVGIVTLAILIGRTCSYVLYAVLLFTPYVIFVVLGMKYSVLFLLPMVTFKQAFAIERQFRNESTLQKVPRQTAKLNLFFGLLYVVACLTAPQLPFIARK
ncbi:ubiA prenyltransferase domain-containing protein 1 homolog [Anopheles stephensi]|nr:ubiA prenyltransferase domain-containing protein 1 homolog [Anopheles stephensi]